MASYRESPFLISLQIQGQSLWLHPERALFWQEQDRVLLADLHMGKAGHFRKAGIPVPQAVARQTLVSLEKVLAEFAPSEVWILGDLFHSSWNYEWKFWEAFMDRFPQTMFSLVPGNHDRSSKALWKTVPMAILEEEEKAFPFVFSHEPMTEIPTGFYNIAGHVHPAVRLLGKGRQSMRLPCFLFGAEQALLPAMGAFTGLHEVKPTQQDQVFVLLEGRVVAV